MDALETKWFYMFIIYLYNIYMLIIIYKKDTCRNVKQKWFRIFSFCPTPEIWKKHVEYLLLDYGIYIYMKYIYIHIYIHIYIYTYIYIINNDNFQTILYWSVYIVFECWKLFTSIFYVICGSTAESSFTPSFDCKYLAFAWWLFVLAVYP